MAEILSRKCSFSECNIGKCSRRAAFTVWCETHDKLEPDHERPVSLLAGETCIGSSVVHDNIKDSFRLKTLLRSYIQWLIHRLFNKAILHTERVYNVR